MTTKPVCFVPGRTFPEVFPGVPSFLGIPVASSAEEAKGHDVGVFGVPWEGPVTWGGFSSCELATKTIRDASQRYGGFLPEFGYDIFDHLTLCDCGDAAVTPGNIAATFDSIKAKASGLLEQGVMPLAFGGDHSISIPLISALAEHTNGKVGIVHLDAHMDNMDSFGDEPNARCCPMHRLYDHPAIDPTKMVHMGIRGPRNNPRQLDFAREAGAHIVSGFEMKTRGMAYCLDKALEIVKDGTEAVYVTVCSDILDVAHNPAGPPDMNGLSSFELSSLLYGLGSAGFQGFDFVEIYPPNDPNGVSSHVATWMAIYMMSGLARLKSGLNPDFHL